MENTEVKQKSIDDLKEQEVSGENVLGGGFATGKLYCDSNGNTTTNASRASSNWNLVDGICRRDNGHAYHGGGG